MFTCLLLPGFLLQAACRWRQVGEVCAVVEEQGVKGILIEASEKARALGIEPGMTCPQAMARHMKTDILCRSLVQEDCLHELLLEVAFTRSSDVELTAPGLCILDLRRKWKTPCWQQLGDELVKHFRQEGLDLHVGVAATPDLAILAAHEKANVNIVYDAPAFVRGLPLSALSLSSDILEVLKDWGIKDVKGLLALPQAEVIDRLGLEAESLFKKLSGRHKRPLHLAQPLPRYQEAFDFEHEVDATEPLLFLLRRFLDSLTARLRSAHRVAQKLLLQIPLEGGETYIRDFAIPAPTTDGEVLYRILDTHLESLRLEKRPIGIRLEIESSLPLKNQLGLFETAIRDLNAFGATLAKLKAFLGNDRVGVPRKTDSHKADAFLLEDFFYAKDNPAPLIQRGIPMRRFRPALSVQIETRNGEPVFVRSPHVAGEVHRHAGPFQSSGQWWEKGWKTEEWDVELKAGGVYRLSRQKEGWRLEGSYELC